MTNQLPILMMDINIIVAFQIIPFFWYQLSEVWTSWQINCHEIQNLVVSAPDCDNTY